MRFSMILLVTAALAAPAFGQDDPLAPAEESDRPVLITPEPTTPRPPPIAVLVVPKSWKEVFAAIRAGDWVAAQAGIAALPTDILTPVAKAELLTAKGSPKADLAPLVALMAEAPDLPQGPQLQRMAAARGGLDLPPLAPQYRLVSLPSAPRRHRSRPVQGDPVADTLRAQLDPLVKVDDAPGAEALYLASQPLLTAEGRAEAAQRVAWIYYVLNDDVNARRVAETASDGGSGEWVTQANWIAGLASWRQNDCEAAARHFRSVASGIAEPELAAAGAYWAARAEMACRRPQNVAVLLRAAARSPESFYGLLARETLGMDTRVPRSAARPESVDQLPNVRRAVALLRIGETALADELLRFQARLGPPQLHAALAAKARQLGLAAAAYWIAHNGPPGARTGPEDRFPLPRWSPPAGWRIDPALAFAHARQESDFRTAAVSPAGAVGLMQVRPGTAGDIARQRGQPLGSLADPATNLEYGQSFIEAMRGLGATRGQLPKVIAAYNAGPLPVDRWNYVNDRGDPLLWIESLPYWETRYYVPAVLRNMWVYQALAREPQPELRALAEHRWPNFPARRGFSSQSIGSTDQ